jgi:hypothetical protein
MENKSKLAAMSQGGRLILLQKTEIGKTEN